MELNMVCGNGRAIGAPDKLFGINALANERAEEIGKENVINCTIGKLLDDKGNLVVLSSVVDCLRNLSPADFADYAPIAGIPAYLEACKKAVFVDEMPEAFVEGCFTPGGTGAIRNAVSCYTKPGERIITGDWYWSPYKLIAKEQGRDLVTYTLFDKEGKFNHKAFGEKLAEVLAKQEETLIIINTPAHNPTGYTFSHEDWDKVIEELKKFSDKKIALLVDIAYIDFAGEQKKTRGFFSKLVGLPDNILPMVAFSASKGFTLYGMRCGALLCMAPNAGIAKEFVEANKVASRATWSNGNRAAMTVIAQIFNNKELLEKVTKERNDYMRLLSKRGQAFMEEAEKAGIVPCAFDSGFFLTVPCENAEAVGVELQKENIFAVAIGEGIRVAVASIPEDKCRLIPAKLAKAIQECARS